MKFKKMVERKKRIEVIKFGQSALDFHLSFNPNDFFHKVKNRFPKLEMENKNITIKTCPKTGHDEIALSFVYLDPDDPIHNNNFPVWHKILITNNEYLVIIRKTLEDMETSFLEMGVMSGKELMYHWELES